MFSELIQHQTQVLGMIFLVLGKDQNVIEVDQDEVICVGVEDEIHHARERWRSIDEAKRHSYEPKLVLKAVLGISCSRIRI